MTFGNVAEKNSTCLFPVSMPADKIKNSRHGQYNRNLRNKEANVERPGNHDGGRAVRAPDHTSCHAVSPVHEQFDPGIEQCP